MPRKLTECHRYPKLFHLHHPQRGPHPVQPSPRPPSQGPCRPLCRLQEYVLSPLCSVFPTRSLIFSPPFCLEIRHLTNTPAVPHPLFAKVELRVQTDGSITPKEAVVSCSKKLVSDLGQFSREFTKEFELRKMVANASAAPQMQNGQL